MCIDIQFCLTQLICKILGIVLLLTLQTAQTIKYIQFSTSNHPQC